MTVWDQMSSSGVEAQLGSSDDLYWRPFLDEVGTRGHHETSFTVENILRRHRDSFPRQNVRSLACCSSPSPFLPWSGSFFPEHLKPLCTTPCIEGQSLSGSVIGQQTDLCLNKLLLMSSSVEVHDNNKGAVTSSLRPSETNTYTTQSVDSSSASSRFSSNAPPPTSQLPYWIYCTRYSDRPSAGRCRPTYNRRPILGSTSYKIVY